MSTREVITVQLGNYANFVGAHVWNLQGQLTYTPRLVVADLPGSLGHLKNDLYDPPPSAKEQISWSGKVTIHKTEPVPKSSSSHSRDQSLRSFSSDEDKDICRADLTNVGGASEIPPPNDLARHWTDFLKVDFHPKTVNLVHGYHHNSRDDPFDLYGQGVQCYEDSAWQEGFLDRLRWFAEDSDSLQAFSVVLDAHDGFSGLAGGLLEHLGDNYPSKAALCWPLFQPHYRALKEGAVATERAHRCFNAVMCYGSLSRLSSGFCPLSVSADHFKGTARTFQHLRLLDQEQYQTSAVLGSALDSFYCGLKLKNQPLELTQLLGQLTGVGRRMASLSCSFPLGLPENGLLENHSCVPVPLTPGAIMDARQDMSLAVVRGCPQDLISSLARTGLQASALRARSRRGRPQVCRQDVRGRTRVADACRESHENGQWLSGHLRRSSHSQRAHLQTSSRKEHGSGAGSFAGVRPKWQRHGSWTTGGGACGLESGFAALSPVHAGGHRTRRLQGGSERRSRAGLGLRSWTVTSYKLGQSEHFTIFDCDVLQSLTATYYDV
ncbi:protein misato homolog 1 isoform X2 [Ixodes scapularis]